MNAFQTIIDMHTYLQVFEKNLNDHDITRENNCRRVFIRNAMVQKLSEGLKSKRNNTSVFFFLFFSLFIHHVCCSVLIAISNTGF